MTVFRDADSGRVFVLNADGVSALRDASGAWARVAPMSVDELEDFSRVDDPKESESLSREARAALLRS